jgi:hypothetical protein
VPLGGHRVFDGDEAARLRGREFRGPVVRRPSFTSRCTTARLAPLASASWSAVFGSVAAASTFA